MKVALIGDVHANLPALETVLTHARQQDVEEIWNTGDLVGYGAFPNQVIDRLREEDAISIVGNYDLKVLKLKKRKKRKKWRKKKQPEKFLAFQWAYENLSKKNRKYLRSLPKERNLSVGDEDEPTAWKLLLTHGSPASNEEHLEPDTPEERLRELAAMTEANVIICGHSHQPFAREVDGVHFINTGSVGRPDDGDPRACYAILEIEPGALQVQHYRLTYDVERAVAAIREQRLPEALAQMMIQGYALDEVMEEPQTWNAPPIAPPPWGAGEKEQIIQAVLRVAESYDYKEDHTHHVTHLTLRLFDELRALHQFGLEERFWLRCGALLHDIGWIEGRKGHHKTSRDLILKAELPFDKRKQLIIACIARYHRRALPKDKHAHFAALSPVDQYRVTVLSAILRVADGLDRTHRNVVQDLACEITRRRLTIRCDVRMYPIPEREQALKKGDLFEHVFDRELVIGWRMITK